MKLFQVLTLTAILLFVSGAAFAGLAADDCVDHRDDDFQQPIPEPSAALVMATGLLTVAAARRLRDRR